VRAQNQALLLLNHPSHPLFEMTQLYVKKSTASSIFLKGCAFFRRTFSVASVALAAFCCEVLLT
ncbi:hypothetical protein MF069_16065, partial [Paenibacillus mucilaginosus]|uniref:hypothetical protein n=1 Tax=Paenibacillus mucilaginosus TaxID=61624 RepID=UPI001EEF87E6